MHLDFDKSFIKDQCQIFTPEQQVIQMLDLAGYTKCVYGKKVLENSCGNGEFLKEIVTRYVQIGRDENISDEDIKMGLEQDIVAYEIDDKLIAECKRKLNEIIEKYGISNVNWNIMCEDFLADEVEILFDYIIGNPPYIAYPDLPTDVRKYIKDNFLTCKKGKFDYSYAFIEKSYNNLAQKGKLIYYSE